MRNILGYIAIGAACLVGIFLLMGLIYAASIPTRALHSGRVEARLEARGYADVELMSGFRPFSCLLGKHGPISAFEFKAVLDGELFHGVACAELAGPLTFIYYVNEL